MTFCDIGGHCFAYLVDSLARQSDGPVRPDATHPAEGRTMTTRPTALDAFLAAKAAIDRNLARLQALSENHFEADPDTLTWGQVGDLQHLLAGLQDLTDRACRDGEYAA